MKHNPKILFLISGLPQGTYGLRAQGLIGAFSSCNTKIVHRQGKIKGAFIFIKEALSYKPDIIYLMNISISGIVACLILKILFNKKYIIDTGDITYELFNQLGKNRLFCVLVKIVENCTLKFSSAIITRGEYHKKYLKDRNYKNIHCLVDGVDIVQFQPQDNNDLRSKIAPNNELIIGVIGSLVWVKKLGLCYGWDLIEALHILKDKPLKALIIGDGSGRDYLEREISTYGIKDKIEFVGMQPFNKLPDYVNIMDICLSTQTNDIVGWVRTTAKLPLYLACGKYVLATDVGTAHDVLPSEMRLPYKGKKDLEYPKRLAEAISNILNNREILNKGIGNRKIALEKFDYKTLSQNLEKILLDLV